MPLDGKPKQFHLVRYTESDGGTWGAVTGDGYKAQTLERPWKNNAPFVSCIPEGTYRIRRDKTGKQKYYKILEVEGRSDIELHPANSPGELLGCIAFGESIHKRNDRCFLLHSKSAMDRFLALVGDDDVILTISKKEES